MTWATQQEFADPTPLPEWVTEFRPGQQEAAEAITAGLRDRKVMFLDAPTGSGKTLIAELVRRYTRTTKAVYSCTTKTLQDQVARDFPYAKVLKGRANYPTLDAPHLFPNRAADLCDRKTISGETFCTWCADCEACPYALARAGAERAPLAITNLAYLLSDFRLPFNRSAFQGLGLGILDEADMLRGELAHHIEVSLSRALLKELRVGELAARARWATRRQWIQEQVLPALAALRIPGQDPKAIRRRTRIRRLRGLLEDVAADLSGDNWVYMEERKGVVFRPIEVAPYAKDRLWRHGRKWLLMSATVISPARMAEELGLELHEWGSYSLPSTFPAYRRPIYVQPLVRMTHRNKDEAWPRMAAAVRDVVDQHPGVRVLVHSVSYALARKLTTSVGPRGLTYTSAQQREGTLTKFKATEDAVLVAPSFDRGVDLAGALCRVIVIPKIPYPNLGDKMVSARYHAPGGKQGYVIEALRTLVQMTGRGMRSENDFCETYVLDAEATRLLDRHGSLIPGWWREAVK